MLMRMMHVGNMRVAMRQGRMSVPMRMWLGHRIAGTMAVLMMGIMGMQMLMLQWFVGVFMFIFVSLTVR